jgi:integrase
VAIKRYEIDGQPFWSVYVNLRSQKTPTIRVQRRVNNISSEKAAIHEEKKLIQLLAKTIVVLESKGATWDEVITKWVRHQQLFPSRKLVKTTLIDYEAMLRNWTKPWLNRTASDLNRADGRELFNYVESTERKFDFRSKLRYVINSVYVWGIEERLIVGPKESPVYGMDVKTDREEKRPEILTKEEIRILLRKAYEQNHPWFEIWTSAVFTGCRSGELHQLRRKDLEIVSPVQAEQEDLKPFNQRRYGVLRVQRSWNRRTREVGPTKAGYWRTVPVCSEFYWFLVRRLNVGELKPEDYLLPRDWRWDKGEQARVLRAFCLGNALPQVKFHTLRACFATQLISSGIPATVVMKICGWKDLKTMQRYIRLAGIEEAGATEVLSFVPTDAAVMEKVVSLYDWKKT